MSSRKSPGYRLRRLGLRLGAVLFRRLPFLDRPYNRLLLLAMVTGLSTATMALVLKFLVHRIELLIMGLQIHLPVPGLNLNLASMLTPAAGIGLTILLVRRFIKADLSHGVTSVLRSIAVGNARMPGWSTWAYVVACSLTSGFGGSVGMEAPMLATGAGIGARIGTSTRTPYNDRVVLMACGAAAAVAAIFKAPIAGMIIALEVLAIDSALRAVLPVIIGSASGAVLSMFFTDQTNTFSFTLVSQFQMENIPLYLILGVLCGLVSVMFTRVSYGVDGWFKSWSPLKRFLTGSLGVGILVMVFPPLFGEGYESMRYLLGGTQSSFLEHSVWNPLTGDLSPLPFLGREGLFLMLLGSMIFLKSLSSALTLSGGGVGGIFAPSLQLGCLTGYVLSHALNLTGFFHLPETNFSLVGMAAVLGGIMHAPLSGMFLIAEITGGYNLFIPLMLSTVASVFTVRRFESHSIYTYKLAREGKLISQARDESALSFLDMQSFVHPDSLDHPADPVTRGIRVLLGNSPMTITTRTPVRELVEAITTPAADAPGAMLHLRADPGSATHLPVVDDQGHYIGYVVLSEILTAYRQQILRMSQLPEDHPWGRSTD